MSIPVFLSYPGPHREDQRAFIDQIRRSLRERDLEPRTLGVNEYDMDAPLRAVRRLMIESNGLITVAFKRTWAPEAVSKKGADLDSASERPLGDTWFTSPWCHIEPAMAFQLGLPIIILREKSVLEEGMLERGIVDVYMPSFDLDQSASYLESKEWKSIIRKWEARVRAVVEKKGHPPKLY